MPYFRLQGGKAAIKLDPVKGDIGLAVFCQRDISAVKKTRKTGNPASFRYLDKADAIYIGGLLNVEPSIILELLQDGTAKLTAPAKVIVDTPEAEFTANLKVNGLITSNGINNTGDITNAGNITNTGGAVSSNGIVLDTHVHRLPGGGTTEGPQ